jgi:hypothetical protein
MKSSAVGPKNLSVPKIYFEKNLKKKSFWILSKKLVPAMLLDAPEEEGDRAVHRVFVLGATASGKSALVRRIVEGVFTPEHRATLGWETYLYTQQRTGGAARAGASRYASRLILD